MVETKKILLVGVDGKGGVINLPAQFDYPAKKMVAEKWFFNTGRYRTIGDDRVAVFTEEGFKLDLDDYADPKTDDEIIADAIGTNAEQELDDILGNDSIFTAMIVEWHNKHIGERI